MNAIFMVTCSWLQQERRRRSRRRLADPLSTNKMKGASCSFMSWHSSSPSSLKRIHGTRRDDLRYRSRRSRYAIFLPWLRPQGYDTFVTIFTPILVRWSPVPARRTHMNDVLEPSTQIWNRRVWTRNYSGERAQNLFTAPDRWLPARTRSRVEASCDLHRARL